MNPDIVKLQKQIDGIQEQLDLLKNTTTIPLEVDTAFRDRLEIEQIKTITSTKTAASETQLVNESGTGSYNVAKPMDGFEERVMNGEKRYYPYYT